MLDMNRNRTCERQRWTENVKENMEEKYGGREIVKERGIKTV